MTIIAILMILCVVGLPLAYQFVNPNHLVTPRTGPSNVPLQDVLRLKPPASPSEIVAQKGSEAERRVVESERQLARIQRLIEEHPDRGAAVVRGWLWQG